jgi:transcriptional regulator with XRE-family HTH domain
MASLRVGFGRAVRRIRTAAGFSQESLAHACQLNRTYMGLVERGEATISLDNIEKVAKALHTKVSDLLTQAERER